MVTREQLVADVNAAQIKVDAAQDILDTAQAALYEYDVAKFSKATGLQVGDELLIIEDMRKMLRARMWAEFIIELWSIGKEIKIVGIDPDRSEFAIGSGEGTGSTGGIHINMIKKMRAAWLAQHEVTT